MGYASLGDRMKAYEESFTQVLPPTLPIVIRIDGRAFHTYTRGMDKPYSHDLREAMLSAAYYVMDDAMNSKLAYVQSDEITIVMVCDRYESEHWFGGVKRKIESVSASIATVGFNKCILYSLNEKWAEFDARSFSLPFHEVTNNILWRIQDAERNSVQMLARSKFSHKECEDKNISQLKSMLKQIDCSWDNMPSGFKYGSLAFPSDNITHQNRKFPSPLEDKDYWNNILFGNCVYTEGYTN